MMMFQLCMCVVYVCVFMHVYVCMCAQKCTYAQTITSPQEEEEEEEAANARAAAEEAAAKAAAEQRKAEEAAARAAAEEAAAKAAAAQKEAEEAAARAAADEGRANKAAEHAKASFDSLTTLGDAYRFVRRQRSHHHGPAKDAAPFQDLMRVLNDRGRGDGAGVDHARRRAADVAAAAAKSEQAAAEKREDLGASQREIRGVVAAHAEKLDAKRIESLEELPEEMQGMIKNRGLKRLQHSRELRAAQTELIKVAVASSQCVLQAGSPSVGSGADLRDTVLKRMTEREAALQAAIDAASAGVVAYNNQPTVGVDAPRSVMGALVSPDTSPGAPPHRDVARACGSYDDWVATYLGDKHAQETDAAMATLKAKLTDDTAVAAALRLQDEDGDESGARNELETAFEAAGQAIAAEREHQLRDAMGFFPSADLLRVGRELLGAWQAQSAAVQRAVLVDAMLQADIDGNDACIDDTGKLSLDKTRILQEIGRAKEAHKKAAFNLHMLKPVIDFGAEEQRQGVLQVLKLPDDTTLGDLREHVRQTQHDLTAATLEVTGDIQQHFPEVVFFVGHGLPPDLAALWRPSQSLDVFDPDRQKLVQQSPHIVRQVWDGSESFAIKEYNITGADQLRTWLREAAIIYRHRHPAIVEIKALFQGTGDKSGTFYMQMPWYEHGSLDQWVGSDQRPDWSKVRSVLLDALLGIEHLHGNRIIHGDIKPANILVDSRERGRLADFDISIDTNTRTSAASIMKRAGTTTVRATAVGMTVDFAAPELKEENKATKHTDMFAYGKTVECVQAHCEPDDPSTAGGLSSVDAQARGQTAALVTALTAAAARARPSAQGAMQTAFFTILEDVCKKSVKTCSICFEDSDAGVECSEGHFHCRSCLADHATHFMAVGNTGERKQREGCLKCSKFPRECRSGFEDQDLAKHLPAVTFQDYLTSKLDAIQEQLRLQLDAEYKEKYEAEVEKMRALDERGRKVMMARTHIINKILTLSCPNGHAFVDFDGCFALKCSMCPCHFCGWCLADCGGDAHAHVRTCGHKPAGANDPYFGTKEQFEEAHRKQQRVKIRSYLNEQVDASLKRDIVDACRTELERNRLWPIL